MAVVLGGDFRLARLPLGDESLLGEGELAWNGRFRVGELSVRLSVLSCVGWEFNTTLGGVCQLSDCVLRNGRVFVGGVAALGAVCGRWIAGVRSIKSCGVSLIHGKAGVCSKRPDALALAGVIASKFR